MIPPKTIAEIERMLAEDQLSQRGIARRFGVSRGKVNEIALGRRPDYEALAEEDRLREALVPKKPHRRCPECRVKVLMPCVACRARKALATSGRRLAPDELLRVVPVVIGLDLKPEHYERYSQVRPKAIARHFEQHAGVAPRPK